MGATQVRVAVPVPVAGGADPVGASTAMAKGPIDAVVLLSLATIMILAVVPTLPTDGVPLSAPVLLLKLAHAGLRLMENVTPVVLGETTVGRNEYVLPAVTLVGGEPCKINWAAVGGAGAVGVVGDVVEVEEESL